MVGDDSPPGLSTPGIDSSAGLVQSQPMAPLPSGFSGAPMRPALAPQTQFPAALLVEHLEVEGGRLQDQSLYPFDLPRVEIRGDANTPDVGDARLLVHLRDVIGVFARFNAMQPDHPHGPKVQRLG
jgi:hypothetical protein